jgi:hypothetical protein
MSSEQAEVAEQPYPEHIKLKAISARSQAIGEFLEWLTCKKGFTICQLHREEFMPVYTRTENLLAEFFEIDLDKIEAEKRAMLAELRRAHESPASHA